MRDSGVIREPDIKGLEEIGCLLLPPVLLVRGRCIGDESKRVKHLGLNVRGVGCREITHGELIIERSSAVGDGGSIVEYEAERVNETALAFRGFFECCGPIDLLLGGGNARRRENRLP
jgi:hypothetical protein